MASPGQRKGQAGRPGSLGSPLWPPTLFRKLSLHCSGPPGRGPASACAPASWGAWAVSDRGGGVILSPSCHPAAGTARPEEVLLPAGQCRGVGGRGTPNLGKGSRPTIRAHAGPQAPEGSRSPGPLSRRHGRVSRGRSSRGFKLVSHFWTILPGARRLGFFFGKHCNYPVNGTIIFVRVLKVFICSM